jgi:hypothetical protein
MGTAGRRRLRGGVNSTGWAIGWVVLTADITGDEQRTGLVAQCVNKFENFVCGAVLAVSFPPSFNDTSVISVDFIAWDVVAACK